MWNTDRSVLYSGLGRPSLLKMFSCHAESGRSYDSKNIRRKQFQQIWRVCNRKLQSSKGFIFLGDMNTENSVGPFTIAGNSTELTDSSYTWFNDKCWTDQDCNYKKYD